MLKGQRFTRAMIEAAFESRLDEGHDFQRNTDVHRGLSGLEKFHDLLEKLTINVLGAQADMSDAGIRKSQESIVTFALSDATNAGQSAVFPLTRDHLRSFFQGASHPLTARAHDRVKNLNGVNTVVKKSRVALEGTLV